MGSYFINTAPNSHLPKPGQYSKVQNCRVCHYCHKFMNKMEVAEKSKEIVMHKNANKTVTEIYNFEKIPRSKRDTLPSSNERNSHETKEQTFYQDYRL